MPAPEMESLKDRVNDEADGLWYALAGKIANLVRRVWAFVRRETYVAPALAPVSSERRQWEKVADWAETEEAFAFRDEIKPAVTDWLQKNLQKYQGLVETVGAEVVKKEPMSIFLHLFDAPNNGIVGSLALWIKSSLFPDAHPVPDFSMHREFLETFTKETKLEPKAFREKLLCIFRARTRENPIKFRERFVVGDSFYQALGQMTVGNSKEAGKEAFDRDPFCTLLYLSKLQQKQFIKKF
jgi:hypothetical protein